MTTSLTRNDSFILGLLIGAVFIIDLLTPLGIADGILYILVVLCTLPHRNTRLTFGIALGCSVLTLLGLAWSPEGGEWWKVIWNRGLALFAIWTTAILGYRHQRQAQTIGQHDKALQTVMNHMPSACFTFDHEGRILSWNQAAERIYGYSPEEAIGRYSWDLIVTPETRADTQRIIDGVFQGQSFLNQLWHDRNKQGEHGWRLGNLFPVLDEKGHVAYGLNMNVDITPQKAAEECLAAQHRLLQAIIQSSVDPIYAKDRTGKYILINQSAAATIGTTEEEVLGLTDEELFPPHTAKSLADHDQFVLTQADNLHVEEEVPINGQTRIFASTKSRLKDSRGTTMGLVGISRDITELKKAQQALRLTDLVFQTSPDQMFILGRDFRFRRVNVTFERLHGLSAQDLLDRPMGDILGKDTHLQQIHPLLNRCFQGETIHQGSWVQFPEAGNRYMVESYFPLQNLDGSIDEVVVIGRDWTDWKLSEDALAANEHRLRTILDSMTNFVGIGTPEGIVVDCNQAPLQLAGLQREDVIGKHLTDTYWVNYSPLVQQQVRDILQRVAHGETVREDIRVRMGETTYIMVDACYVPVCDDTGHVIQIVHSGIDVTARRAAETALQKSQRNLQAILDHSPNLIFMKDLEGRYLRINKTFEKAFGLSESAVLGHCDHELFPPAQAEQFHAHDHLVLKHTSLIESEERLLYGQTPHTNFVQRFPIQDEQGTLYALGGIATDITERKQAEEALKKSEERFRKYFESGLVGMAIIAVDHTWIAVNDELCHMVGYSQEELRRITWTTLTHPDDRAEGDVLIHDLLHNQRESFSFIHRYVHKNGSLVYVKIHANAVRDAHGQVEYLMVMIQDLTKQKEAEAATRTAERLALAAMNALSAHICVLDEQGTILMVNNSWNAFALANGGDPAAVGVGANYFSFVPRMAGGQIPDTAQMLFNMLEVLEGRKQEFSYDYPCVSPTSQRWFTCRVSRIEETHPMRIVVAHQDIHEQKQAELQLREAETFTKSIVDNLPNMIFVKEAQSLRFVQINKAGEHLLGITRQDLLGKSDFDLFPTEEAELFISQDRKVLTERTLLDIPEEPIQTRHAGIRMLHTKKLPICDSFGTPQFLLGISEDITSRKALEDQIRHHANELEAEVDRRATRIQELEQRRMQVEKLAALSQIAAGVAHEINNPLASIAQALTLVKRAIPPDHPKFKYTQKMQACIDRMTHITRQLYTLYRPSTSQPDPIDIAQVIQSAVDIMHPIAEKKQLRLQVTHSWTSSPIQAGIAPGDMIQILCNLIQNAVDASSPLSDIGITTSLTDRTLTITVVDKGMGISPDVLPHIFDPFFTTKYGAQSVGLGLGLAISKNLLSSMGGQLDCSTKEGKGTTFSIILPLPPEYS